MGLAGGLTMPDVTRRKELLDDLDTEFGGAERYLVGPAGVDPAAIETLAEHLRRHPDDPIVTLAAPAAAGDREDPHAVKVVVDRRGYALYFSRAAIPHPRRPGAAPALKHLGIYGYRREALLERIGPHLVQLDTVVAVAELLVELCPPCDDLRCVVEHLLHVHVANAQLLRARRRTPGKGEQYNANCTGTTPHDPYSTTI